jgi:hypothetical protein
VEQQYWIVREDDKTRRSSASWIQRRFYGLCSADEGRADAVAKELTSVIIGGRPSRRHRAEQREKILGRFRSKKPAYSSARRCGAVSILRG